MSLSSSCIYKLKLFLCITGVIITGSIEHITIPIMVTVIPSLYFLLLLIAIEGLLLYIGILSGIAIYNGSDPYTIESWPLALSAINALVTTLMSFCLLYSANPERTPVVIQSMFLGTAIIPSIFFTKFILKKNVQYNYKYSVISLIFLAISIGFTLIPLFQTDNHFNWKNTGWIVMYSAGIILLSLTNILQEKYIIDTQDSTFENKIRMAFYTGFFQVIFSICFFWIDLLLGNTSDIKEFIGVFNHSMYMVFESPGRFFLIQLFVFDCIVLFIISIYLNEISTNYNMILTNLTNQSVALFFTIFPALNHGLHYPLSITMISMFCNIVSVLIWIKGEPNNAELEEEYEMEIRLETSNNPVPNNQNEIV